MSTFWGPYQIEGVDAIINKTTADIKVPVVRMFTGGFLREFLESTVKQSNEMVIFSQTPVAVGDSWRGYPVKSLLGSTQLDMKYTFTASKNSIATVAMISHIKSALTGTLDGVLHVDEKTGLILSSELHQQMGDKPLKTSTKSSANKKLKPATDSAFRVNGQATVHSWIANLSG